MSQEYSPEAPLANGLATVKSLLPFQKPLFRAQFPDVRPILPLAKCVLTPGQHTRVKNPTSRTVQYKMLFN